MIKEIYFKKLKLIFIFLIVVLVISFVINKVLVNQFSLDIYNLQTKIVGVSLTNDIELEEQFNIAKPNQEASIVGEKALKKFGIDRDSITSTNSIQNLLRKMNMLSASFIIFTFILVSIFLAIKIKREDKEISLVNQYLEEVTSGNYSLDIRDNREGNISLLKNNIYKVTEMMNKTNEQLQNQKNSLSKAISDISHQFKTPLTSMQLMTDILSKDNLGKKKKDDFINLMQQQLKRLQWLVLTLLKLAKFDANTVKLRKQEVIVKSLIKKVVGSFIIPIELKEINLKIFGDDNASFKGDFDWSLEALSNILKNCIEYSKTGGFVEIVFEENHLFTQITIKDNGKGIDKKDLPYIFDRFYKGSNSGSDSVGIGLAMSKSIIQKQDGEILARSKLGEGTSFVIKFYKNII